MSGESKESVESVTSRDDETKKTKGKKGVMSLVWNTLFRGSKDDFEKRLQHISKEEAAVLSRIAKRTQSVLKMTRRFILFFVFCELIAVGYAVMTTRSPLLDWKTRASRVLPMFLLPVIFFVTYSALKRFFRMRDQKDHKTLEKLRAERQEKIDELKEKTNYYLTQQLIQRYDPDPAAKAAAATVLASKLGAESGLKVHLGEVIDPNVPYGKSNDVEVSRTTGLRNRKQSLSRSTSLDSRPSAVDANLGHDAFDSADLSQKNPLVVEHHHQTGSSSNNDGWIARLAALLVGEDPTQSYALICGSCHMHNGLARKEDFPYVTYYCPHCQALNRPKNAGTSLPESDLPAVESADEVEETLDECSAAPAPAPAPAPDTAPPAPPPPPAEEISES